MVICLFARRNFFLTLVSKRLVLIMRRKKRGRTVFEFEESITLSCINGYTRLSPAHRRRRRRGRECIQRAARFSYNNIMPLHALPPISRFISLHIGSTDHMTASPNESRCRRVSTRLIKSRPRCCHCLPQKNKHPSHYESPK